MTALAVLLMAAALAFAAAQFLRMPPIPLLVLAGAASSFVISLPTEFLQDVLILGVSVIVFIAGIELNPGRVGRYLSAAVKVGTLQFLLLGGVGLVVASALGFELSAAAYLALALAASSTLVVVRLLQQWRQLYDPIGRLVIGVLLLQDLLIILLIPVVTGIGTGGAQMARGVGATLLLVGLAGVLARWGMPRVVALFAADEEALLLTVFTLLFGFLGLAHLLGVPLIAGAFLAGVSLSGFPGNALVRGQLNSLGDFFSAIFFAALGAILVVPSLLQLMQGLVFALVVIIVTPPLVALVAEQTGFSARSALRSGMLLAQTSEFSLVVGLQGLILADIGTEEFSVIALATVLTMILTPLLATDSVVSFLLRFHPLRHRESEHAPPSDHLLLVGCGSNGTALLETLLVSPRDVWVVDDDPAVIDRVREAGVEAIHGNAADAGVLRSAGASRARAVVSTIRRIEDNGALLAAVGDVPVLVRALNAEDEVWIEARGGIPVPYSEAAARDFLEWFLENGAATREERPASEGRAAAAGEATGDEARAEAELSDPRSPEE